MATHVGQWRNAMTEIKLSKVTAASALLKGLLRQTLGAGILFTGSERSAARLAHQSGGLGVPSSNLGAPTTKSVTGWRASPTMGGPND